MIKVRVPPADKEPALQAAALGDGRPPERGAGHRDHGGHPPRDRQLGQKEVSPGAGSRGSSLSARPGMAFSTSRRAGPVPQCPAPSPLPSPGPSHPTVHAWDPTPHSSVGRGGHSGGCGGHTRLRAEQGWTWGRGAVAIQSGLRPQVVAGERASVSLAFSAGRLRRQRRGPTPGRCTTTLISQVSIPAWRPRGVRGPCQQPSDLGPAPQPSLTVQPRATSPGALRLPSGGCRG